MREILFKAKLIETGAWEEGSVILFPDGDSFIYCTESKNVLWEHQVDTSTICQYTGLNDKNGKKIFDGDVIISDNGFDDSYKFVVCFGACGGAKNVEHEVGYFGFFLDGYDDNTKHFLKCGLRNDIVFWVCENRCEIVGNIHDKEK